MNTLARLLASGVFVCIIPLGLALGRHLDVRRAADRLALAVPLGVGVVSIPLGLCAALGLFRTHLNGAIGWCVAVLAVAWLLSHPERGIVLASSTSTVRARVGVAALVGIAAILYGGFPAETPLGSRDEGLYSLAGLALARAGTLVIHRPDAIAIAPALFAPFFLGNEFYLPGIPAAAVLKPQFSPILPAWIAQLHSVGGDSLLYRINALFALSCIGVFYMLARQIVRAPVAFLAATLFALNAAQVWIARINLSEPLGELLGLAGILLGVIAVRDQSRLCVFAAAAFFALASLVRLDAVVVVPLLFAGATAAALWLRGRDPAGGRMLLRLAAMTLAGQAIAVFSLWVWSPDYVSGNALGPVAVLVASSIFALGYFLVRRNIFEWTTGLSMRRRIAAIAAIALVLLFAYAALVRPHVGPFALIPGTSAIAGLRDFREESLPNLAAYLGWPTLVIALVGACAGFARTVLGRADAASAMLVTLAIGTSVGILAAPHVSPDHFWAVRRFVALLIPLFLLMAGYGIQCAMHRIFGWRYRQVLPIMALGAALSMLWIQRATLFVRENAGLTAQLRALDATLPNGRLLVRDLEAVATTFALGFGRGVLPLRDEHVAVGDAEQAFWLSCRATPCTLLHNSFDGLDGLELAPKRIASLTRQYIAPTFAPLARETVHETTEILVTSIAGLDRDPPPRNVGGVRDWRLPDRGLFRDERSAAGASRWTDGDAELALPQVRANAIELRIAVAPPEPREVRIELDGKSIFEKRIDPGEHVLRFDLASPEPMLRRLALRSSTFVPQKLGLSSDRRTLGILVRAIRLIDEALPPLTAEAPKEAYRSAIIVLGPDAQSPVRLKRNQSAWPLTVRVDHLGAMAWPVRGHVADGEPHVALGVFWTRAGQRERVAEQRVPLPYALRPGERWWTVVPLDLSSTPLNDLPAGDYEVSIGLVHEGVAWFADHGDALARINVKIVP